ncbi:MAG: DNA repair exonuclease [Armatimonadota bacterium]|nr:DNA repair exonuclease [Armatimonadota bacterium]MDW8157045.1 DNA repair exonuclease [Armatimonadota bacterium]
MIRILHVADVHLGARFSGLGSRGADQREQLRRTFARCVDLAVERKCQVVLVAGDLFDNPNPPRDLAWFASDQLRRLVQAGLRVFVVAGNHDSAPDGVWTRPDFRSRLEGVVVFGDRPEAVRVEDALCVVGRSATPGRNPLEGWPPREACPTVGVAHGPVYRPDKVEDPAAVRPDQIRSLKLDYLALGDWHSAQQVEPPPYLSWYAGAPEFLSLGQPGFGHVLLVTVEAPGRVSVVPVRVARRRYHREVLSVEGADEQTLRGRLEGLADPDLVLELVVQGLREPDHVLPLQNLVQEYADRFFRLVLRDQTHPKLDEEALRRFEPTTVLGQFVRRMQDRLRTCPPEDRPHLEEALQLGVAALQGRGVVG